MPMDMKLIGQRIAEVRESRGLSQSELARRLGVKPQAVQKWESGGAPRTHRITAIAAALDVSPRSLVGDSDAVTEASLGISAWPFNRVKKEDFDTLSLKVKGDIEDYIEMKINKAKPQSGGQNKQAA